MNSFFVWQQNHNTNPISITLSTIKAFAIKYFRFYLLNVFLMGKTLIFLFHLIPFCVFLSIFWSGMLTQRQIDIKYVVNRINNLFSFYWIYRFRWMTRDKLELLNYYQYNNHTLSQTPLHRNKVTSCFKCGNSHEIRNRKVVCRLWFDLLTHFSSFIRLISIFRKAQQ